MSDFQQTPSPEGEVNTIGLAPDILRAVRDALGAGHIAKIEELIEPLHPADVADLLELLTPDERALLIGVVRHIIDPETLSYLEDPVREEVVALLGPKDVAAALSAMDSDDAVDVLEDLDEASKRHILASVPEADRIIFEEGLTFPEDSAGRLMQRELVALPRSWTIGQSIDFLRSAQELPDDFYDLFIVDENRCPVGSIPLSRVLRSQRGTRLDAIMDTELRQIPASLDQEEVAYMFRQYGLVSAPVIDDTGKLIGVITVDDVVHVVDEEAEEDMLSLSGVGEDDFHAGIGRTATRRIRWLVVTLINTVIASSVISHFQATIQQVVSLAVLMPIVAAMGGNAGMQSVTVTVRALANRDLALGSNLLRAVFKEVSVGLINALFFALVMGTVAALWFHDPRLGAALSLAMIFNMLWAGFAGIAIPVTLHRLGFDPAVSAGPFLTTTTDVLGFLSFLGIATLILL